MIEIVGLAYWALCFLFPPAYGFFVGRKHLDRAGWKIGLIGGTPAAVIAFVYATFLTITTYDATCEPPDCSWGPMFATVIFGVGLFALVAGFALAFLGQLVGKKTGAPD
jgi:hypothetical protein